MSEEPGNSSLNIAVSLHDAAWLDALDDLEARGVVLDSVEEARESADGLLQVQRGLAQGLTRDGAGVDLSAAHDLGFLDDGDGLAEFGRLDRGLLTGGPGADDDAVVMLHSVSPV